LALGILVYLIYSNLLGIARALLEKGEILGFLGPNGAGKSTTMKILTCSLMPTSGKIFIDTLHINEHSEEIKTKIGYLPENNPLYDELMVMEYLEYIASIRKIDAQIKNERLKEIISLFGLQDVLKKDISELSKGFRQRVGLAQAMLSDPPILILDEPTSGLDPNQIVEIRDFIKKIGKEKTIILSTHNLAEVEATCSRVLIISSGKLVANGTPTELQSQAKGGLINVKIKGDYDIIFKTLHTLDDLVGVKDGESESNDIHGFTIETFKNTDLRESIYDLTVANNWKLLELKQDKIKLEHIFRNLTNN